MKTLKTLFSGQSWLPNTKESAVSQSNFKGSDSQPSFSSKPLHKVSTISTQETQCSHFQVGSLSWPIGPACGSQSTGWKRCFSHKVINISHSAVQTSNSNQAIALSETWLNIQPLCTGIIVGIRKMESCLTARFTIAILHPKDQIRYGRLKLKHLTVKVHPHTHSTGGFKNNTSH